MNQGTFSVSDIVRLMSSEKVLHFLVLGKGALWSRLRIGFGRARVGPLPIFLRLDFSIEYRPCWMRGRASEFPHSSFRKAPMLVVRGNLQRLLSSWLWALFLGRGNEGIALFFRRLQFLG